MSNFRSDIFWIYISYLNSALVDLKIHDRLIPIWNYFIEEELIITHLNWNFLVETVHSFASRSCLWFTNTDSTHQDGKFCWSSDLEKKMLKSIQKIELRAIAHQVTAC